MWFDDVDISAFQSCAVVHLWLPLSAYCLRVFWCAAARMSELELEQRKNIKFLVKLCKSGKRNQICVRVSLRNKHSAIPVFSTDIIKAIK